MKRTYIITVEVDEDEHTSLNASRAKGGKQTRTIDDEVAFEACGALTSKLFSGAACVSIERTGGATRLGASTDTDSTL